MRPGVQPASQWGEEIDAWVEAKRNVFLGTVRDLVQIPTENTPPTGEELAGQRYLKGLMEGLGAEADLFYLDEVEGLTEHPAYWPGRDYSNRPNLVGTFRGTGGGRSLCFSSHMDTAARQPLPWDESTPFSGEVHGGRIYGRGAYDMKGGLIATLFAARAVRELGVALRGDVLIESTVDEEWGGSNGTLASRLRGHNVDACIVPEPSHMVICPAHLGVRIYRLTVSGQAGMRFGGETFTNPVVAMARVVQAFQEFTARRQAVPLPAIYEGGNPPPIDILRIHAEAYGVPRECSFDFFLHFFEGETEEGLDAAVRGFADEVARLDELNGVAPKVEVLSRFLPGSSIPKGHPIVGCAQEAMGEISGRDVVVRGAPFACDGYAFNLYSPMPALILGPGGARAHAQDEYAEVEDLVDLIRVYARMILKWCV